MLKGIYVTFENPPGFFLFYRFIAYIYATHTHTHIHTHKHFNTVDKNIFSNGRRSQHCMVKTCESRIPPSPNKNSNE